MGDPAPDPYAVLGVTADASDAELRRAYRELVKRHHPDHNGGSAESAARFEQIQAAWAQVAQRPRSSRSEMDDRIADIEAELRRQTAEREAAARAQAAREAATATAREAAKGAADAGPRRPTQEELGHYETDDSFTQIIDDAAEQLAARLRGSETKRQFARRLSDLFGGRNGGSDDSRD